jgi:2-keto-3-deoxy-L-rhamnonate aldolase RhmA
MLPRVTGAEQVHAALEIIKYPPIGKRGCAFNRGHTDFRGGPLAENMAKANVVTLLWVRVETRGALASAEEIAAIPGVDALFSAIVRKLACWSAPQPPESRRSVPDKGAV